MISFLCEYCIVCLALIIAPLSSVSIPNRVVPSEWQSTITGFVNGTVVDNMKGVAQKSSAQQSVVIHHASGSGGGSDNATLWRADLLSMFYIHRGPSSNNSTTCQRSQLYESEILLLLDFLHAPGTVHKGIRTINGRVCDVWGSSFIPSTPYGKFVCLETLPSLAYQRPVQYWLKLPALGFVVDFERDFKAADTFPKSVFAVPSVCPQPNVPRPLPEGLVDSFEKKSVASFWMPPLSKYYTYAAGPPI